MGGPRGFALEGQSLPVHEVRVDDFGMGRYLVTCREFCEFLNDEGNPGGRYLVDDDRRRELITEFYEALPPEEAAPEAGWVREALSREECNMRYDRDTGRFEPRGGLALVPANRVTWHGAVAYCAWLSERTGRRYRLPTEAEWEYAARGQEGHRYPWGCEEPVPGGRARSVGRMAEFGVRPSQPRHRVVGSFPAADTPQGVSDMFAGWNEWCSDAYSEQYYAVSPRVNPKGPPVPDGAEPSALRVIRGGTGQPYYNGLWTAFSVSAAWIRFGDPADLVRRASSLPGKVAGLYYGFRVAVEVENGSEAEADVPAAETP